MNMLKPRLYEYELKKKEQKLKMDNNTQYDKTTKNAGTQARKIT